MKERPYEGVEINRFTSGGVFTSHEERPVFDRPTIYIAGPMRNIPDLNRPAFDVAAKAHRRLGWNVISPPEVDVMAGESWTVESTNEAYATGNTPWIRRDVEIVMALQPGRDAVFLLPGWENSHGATAETALARWRGVAILADGVAVAPEKISRKTLGAAPVRAAVTGEFGGESPSPQDWEAERETVMRTFMAMLREVTADGSRKRQRKEKPPWWDDDSHRPAIFSHLNKYEHGEKRDPDSGVHPFVHLAWRALAIAYQETYGRVDPSTKGLDLPVTERPLYRHS